MNKIKERGKIYTPKNIVDLLLRMADYNGEKILEKHIMDNSCGVGNILLPIIEKYCKVFLNKYSDTVLLKHHLETYIHGIEIDNGAFNECINNLNTMVLQYGINNVKWDIKCGNALKIYKKYINKIDYVIGNPPYVNIHNLSDNKKLIKNFQFCKKGMTDLYIAFFEIGIKMLKNNDNSTLCYITPNGYLNSLSGKDLRKYIKDNNMLVTLLNFGHNQVFNASTYTSITLLKKSNKRDYIEYFEGDFNDGCRRKYDSGAVYDSGFKFITSKCQNEIFEILNCNREVIVKNGLATLNDKYFIRDDFGFESKYIIPVIKASKGVKKYLFFPYDSDGKVIPKEVLYKDKNIKKILIEKYSFGRTQAIKDVYKNKIWINNLILDKKSIKIGKAPIGTAVYSGFYIMSNHNIDEVQKALNKDVFIEYIKTVGHYRSGGYMYFSSKDLSKYLTWYFYKRRGNNET